MPSGKPLPRVLVLLAAYNGVAWIAEQIDSILSQQFVEVVLRVSDDCSKDGTYDIVHGFAERHTNVFVSSREVPSGGAGAHFRSMFQALDLAGCDYVALSDQDDVWEPDHLAEHLLVAVLISVMLRFRFLPRRVINYTPTPAVVAV